MKHSRTFFTSILLMMTVLFGLAMAGCNDHRSAEEKVSSNLADSGIYALKPEERQLAETNAKQFFNKDFPNGQDASGQLVMTKGVFLDCRPTDSNANGLVTCHGVVPKMNGSFDDKAVRYCGYRKELVGCSDEDTVPK